MSKFSTLLMPILTEVLLDEIGEANIPPLEWEKINGGYYTFKIGVLGSGESEAVEVMFDPLWVDPILQQFHLPPTLWNSKNTWNVGYAVGGTDIQFMKSNMKTLLQILSTVVDITKDFIHANNPDALYIFPTEKELGKIQKSNLYEAYIKNILSQIPNYYSESRREGILIIKK